MHQTTLAHAIPKLKANFQCQYSFVFISFVSRKISPSLRQTMDLIVCYKIRTSTISSLGAALGYSAVLLFSRPIIFFPVKHNIRASYTLGFNKQTDKQVSFLENLALC